MSRFYSIIPPTATPILVAFPHPPEATVEALQLEAEADDKATAGTY